MLNSKDHDLLIVTNKSAEETERLKKLLQIILKRTVVTEDRRELITIMIKIKTGMGVRELARYLSTIFDFRSQKAPQQSIGEQSLETEIYNIKKAMNGEEE